MLKHLVFTVILGLSLGSVSALQAAPVKGFADETYVTKVARLWTEPSKFGEAIALLKPGVQLRVMKYSSTGAWLRVITEAEREGWIPVRFTALAGRRDRPLVNYDQSNPEVMAAEQAGEMGAVESRSPASIPVETPSMSSGGDIKRKVTPWEFHGGIGYVNQLSRSASSGVSGSLAIQKNTSARLGWVLGVDYNFVYENTSSPDIDLRTTRKSHDLAPFAGLRFSPSDLSILVALGYVHDHTSYKSYEISSGNPLTTDPDTGLLLTGSGNASLILFKLNPSYAIQLSPESRLDISLAYSLYIDPKSGEGSFAADAGSAAQHNLGLGISFAQGF